MRCVGCFFEERLTAIVTPEFLPSAPRKPNSRVRSPEALFTRVRAPPSELNVATSDFSACDSENCDRKPVVATERLAQDCPLNEPKADYSQDKVKSSSKKADWLRLKPAHYPRHSSSYTSVS